MYYIYCAPKIRQYFFFERQSNCMRQLKAEIANELIICDQKHMHLYFFRQESIFFSCSCVAESNSSGNSHAHAVLTNILLSKNTHTHTHQNIAETKDGGK